MKEATDRRDTFNTSPGESEASQQSGGPQWGGGGGTGGVVGGGLFSLILLPLSLRTSKEGTRLLFTC